MPDKFRNKYRISSARLQNWDYSRNAAYFVTICTQGREHYFGNVVNGEMQLSAVGEIAQTEWLKTFDLRPDMNLILGEYIIMPNHFHAIIIIGKNQYNDVGDYGGDKNWLFRSDRFFVNFGELP
jgi:REP element-mobilizing transposase RayT